jgi:N-acetyl-anhydromuramyl-L-alanine amidase AmpD
MRQMSQYKEFKSEGTHKKKTQIILCHTSREAGEYLASLKFRYNGKYDKVPHYLIKKNGEVLQLLQNTKYSNFFDDEMTNKNAVIISLENLGWLERKPLSTGYINWKGSIYNGEVHEKKWRDYFFWDLYPEQQINSLIELCSNLCNELNIEKKCSGHNTKIDGIINFEGIVSRSNFDTRFTDLSPSFSFENFLKKIEHEQIS